ncbi:putative hydrolase of the HAD superfamily [Arcticibacter tournemirensis]|uniref:HAD family phosphatase n=1 Tax=Arcticibacter tournemirensis TaxID=699437 RepID=A0A5M9HJG1_9SPHI|nr:HAD family phosphatase [Arcticibacter tournemirensis]KAA8485574.1 HAD family phosphatase [Arcticibacter tournemirensis]TQM48709.1 putative hydrolase of the HAD superfamily [Arcticibacter tournemirensis]
MNKQTTNIKAIFTDIGGVLLTDGWNHESRREAALHFHIDPADMEERHHLTFETYEIGKISLEEYLNRIFFFQERPFSMDAFETFMYQQSQPYSQMIELIRRLKAEYHLKVGVISNEGRELSAYRIKQFGLDSFGDFFVSSGFVGLRKPDLAIFKLALDLAQVNPDQIVYLEDRPMFVEIAEKMGMHGICHTDEASTRRQLKSLGLK